jgi:hypothetical protein
MPAPIARTTPSRRSSSSVGDVLVRVVQVDDVEMVEAQPVEALGERAEDPVAAEVEDAAVRRGHDEPLVVEPFDPVHGFEHATHLGRDHPFVARTRTESGAETPLREAEPVVRRGVEVADAELPRSIDGGQRVVVRHLRVEVPELRAAEGERGQRDPCSDEGA